MRLLVDQALVELIEPVYLVCSLVIGDFAVGVGFDDCQLGPFNVFSEDGGWTFGFGSWP